MLDQPYYERTKMKKKEKDDVMGEDVSSLPEVQSMLSCYAVAPISCLRLAQYNAKIQPATHSFHGFINCRQGVPMSLPLPSTSVPNAASSGGHIECARYPTDMGTTNMNASVCTRDNELSPNTGLP